MATPAYGKFTSGSKVAATFADRIQGKNILVTGGSTKGLGATTARILAAHKPATLIVTYRSKPKVEDVLAELESISPETKIIGIALDLSDLESVCAAAEKLNQSISHLDILINNAGVMSVQDRELTKFGTEMQFGVNHIGHFLFTNLIMPRLLAAAEKNPPEATRIVNLTGGWHKFGPVRFDDINWEGKPIPPDQEPNRDVMAKFGVRTDSDYIPEAAYAQSKTANILFTVSLNKRLNGRGIVSYAVNPGGVLTEIGRHLHLERAKEIIASGLLDKTPDQGVSSTIVAALDPGVNLSNPVYIDNCQQVPPATYASDPELAEKLWKLSEDIVGQRFSL
ncbi:uncharacterized protein ATNIH1004_008546 [Aspergillus tanneri]|uniref:Uncharacterized protein n=1 Tax=Aspergillus tanneri TaxID=1220188 RepID=A0A5M9MBA4_9EURO|nr:uncharacterized protein ATNIH1004_008546 [Aspergillus tanneri]KAA8644345.1 hypothetical protein ATNIH1004_008546 [Aspergillus tanneri]